MLSAAPASIITPAGQVRQGCFAGATGDIDWARLAPPLARPLWWRRLHHKRWLYVALNTPTHFCAVALVDLGWISTAFGYAFDKQQARVVAGFSRQGWPGLGARVANRCADGAQHRFDFGAHHVRCQHQAERGVYQLEVKSPAFEINAEFDAANPLLLAVGPVVGGVMHATQKSSALALRGRLQVGATAHDLCGGVASFDYSNGLLARNTAWRWASAHQPGLGFNLQAGYFGAQENALWLGGELIALGAAQFEFDPAQPMAPWRICTEDALLSLEFLPLACRREDKNLLLAASRYVQPIGVFQGWVRRSPEATRTPVHALWGVTEDHQARW